MQTITKHYINGAFVESHGHEVMDIVRPTDGQVYRACHAGRRGGYAARDRRGQSRICHLRALDSGRTLGDVAPACHRAASARLDDLTAAMVEEYGGVVQFAGPIVQSGRQCVSGGRKRRSGRCRGPAIGTRRPWTLEPVGVAGLITAWNAETRCSSASSWLPPSPPAVPS